MRRRQWMVLALVLCAVSNAANVVADVAVGQAAWAVLPALAGLACLCCAVWGVRLARREAELERRREEFDARWLREQQQ